MSAERSKVVRTESLVDEHDIYFSHILSSAKPQQQQQQQQQQNGAMKVIDKGHYANIDAEAEEFIKMKHQKFERSAWN
ncbi:hypothetical protein BVRB_6g146620 [Beta vulgaris subsp. vulgaris]|nr:hypothetical protein BVRB_6g146620 [Beta vulgaris subsp. vulgaris]